MIRDEPAGRRRRMGWVLLAVAIAFTTVVVAGIVVAAGMSQTDNLFSIELASIPRPPR